MKSWREGDRYEEVGVGRDPRAGTALCHSKSVLFSAAPQAQPLELVFLIHKLVL